MLDYYFTVVCCVFSTLVVNSLLDVGEIARRCYNVKYVNQGVSTKLVLLNNHVQLPKFLFYSRELRCSCVVKNLFIRNFDSASRMTQLRPGYISSLANIFNSESDKEL